MTQTTSQLVVRVRARIRARARVKFRVWVRARARVKVAVRIRLGLGLVVGLGSGSGGRAHIGPCLLQLAPSTWRLPWSTLCRTYSGEGLGIGLGLGLGLGLRLGLGRGLGLGCVLELGLVGPVVVHGVADGLKNHTHLPGIHSVHAHACMQRCRCSVYAGCMQGVHAWRMHGTCRAYMPHMPLVVPRLLCEHMVCLGKELYHRRIIERLVSWLGVGVGIGLGWGVLILAVSSAGC